jgi:hypothetical protein
VRTQYEHFAIGRADERAARRARAGTGDEQVDDDDDVLDDGVELVHQDAIGRDIGRVNEHTKAFFERILAEMAEEGEFDEMARQPYREWKNMMVLPDDPMIAVPFDEAAWHVMPIFFFDPTVYFSRIGMGCERPCARGEGASL